MKQYYNIKQYSHDSFDYQRNKRKIFSCWLEPIRRKLTKFKATFTLFRFHLDPFLPLKQSYFSSLFTLLRFLNKNGYLSSAVFTLVLKNGFDHLLIVFALCYLFSLFPDYVISVSKYLRFRVFTLQLCVSV